MLAPRIFRMNRLFDDFGEDFFNEPFFKNNAVGVKNISSDVKELDNGYKLEMELPGFAKEDIKAELAEGYLTISAEHSETKNEENNDGKYIRKERYYGKCQRSFFVGDEILQEDINAKFENGILTMFIPKKEEKPAVEEKKYIAIK